MTRSELAHQYPDVFAYLTAIGTLEVLPGQSFYDDAQPPEPVADLDDDEIIEGLLPDMGFEEVIEESAGEVVLTCEIITGEQLKELARCGFSVSNITPITGYVVARFDVPAE